MRRLFFAVIIAIISIIGYYFKSQKNPYTGENQHISLTAKEEIALGQQSVQEMAQQFGGFSHDIAARDRVRALGSRIAHNALGADKEYSFDFHVLADTKTVNAFALPGGQIFITEGLLKILTSEAQLAAVLSHEIGHVLGRHSAERMAKEELTYGLINAAAVATANPNDPDGQAQIAAFVGGMINMKYGRDDELEADKLGLDILIDNSYPPQAMLEVMDILDKASGGMNPPEILSTHPNPGNRKEKIKEYISKNQQKP